MISADALIALILLGGVFLGMRAGLMLEIAIVAGAVIALSVARLEYALALHVFSTLLQGTPLHRSGWLTALSYLVVFAVVWSVVTLVASRVRFFARLPVLGCLDRIGGGLLGFMGALVVTETLLYLGGRVPDASLRAAVAQSHLAGPFLNLLPYVDRFFPRITV